MLNTSSKVVFLEPVQYFTLFRKGSRGTIPLNEQKRDIAEMGIKPIRNIRNRSGF